MREFSYFFTMKPRLRPLIRHCPLCGIAMQASKSNHQLAHFDTFECQTCKTTIMEQTARPSGEPAPGKGGF